MEIYLILAAVLGIFVAVFAIQNSAAVTVKFLLWQFESSLAVLIILAMLSGMLLVFLLSIPGRLKRRKELHDREKKIRQLEKKLEECSSAQTSAGGNS